MGDRVSSSRLMFAVAAVSAAFAGGAWAADCLQVPECGASLWARARSIRAEAFAPRAGLRFVAGPAAPGPGSLGDIPGERMTEIARRIEPLGWTPGEYPMGRWTVYVLEHRDGTIWQTVFANRFQRQVDWILQPERLPAERHFLDALFLEKREELSTAGWHAHYVLPPAPGRFPDTAFQLWNRKEGKVRNTPYESEFRHWLLNGPESCWGADRPFPNCGFKTAAPARTRQP